jgi:hypothetical protein
VHDAFSKVLLQPTRPPPYRPGQRRLNLRSGGQKTPRIGGGDGDVDDGGFAAISSPRAQRPVRDNPPGRAGDEKLRAFLAHEVGLPGGYRAAFRPRAAEEVAQKTP